MKIKIAEKNNKITDEKIVLEIILINKSRNKFSGYKTTIFSNSGLNM